MRGTVLYGPGDVRFEDREEPKITRADRRRHPACRRHASADRTCGRTVACSRLSGPTPMGHEYCGFVEEVGSAVKTVKPGQFVVGSFATSDNTCPHCQHGYQSSCVHREFMTARAGAAIFRVPLADGTLVPTPEHTLRRSGAEPAGDIGRSGHGLVCGGCSERETGQHRRSRR